MKLFYNILVLLLMTSIAAANIANLQVKQCKCGQSGQCSRMAQKVCAKCHGQANPDGNKSDSCKCNSDLATNNSPATIDQADNLINNAVAISLECKSDNRAAAANLFDIPRPPLC